MSSGVPVSTVNRERLDGGSFTNQCVQDNIGWIREDGSDARKVGASLETFWRKTGIQPYVLLMPYDGSIRTADDRFDYADALYDSWVVREDAILLVYFDAKSEDEDGNWEMVKGRLAAGVMDDEATEIFWNYCDRYWYDTDNYNVPRAIEGMFTSTAERIMTKTTTGWDVLKTMGVISLVVVVIGGIVVIMFVRRRHERERVEEVQQILSTPISGPAGDSLVDRYSDGSGGSGST